ncbi:MAG: outer membrane protein transport protein [Nitrospinae bacterium]|nr:outer membrane protein transport protein [Nitrospinota bacterium]
MKKMFLFGFLIVSTFFCQTAQATNGDQVIGIGSYGSGMAGAVTAAPGDSTTAITNPAGLTKVGGRTDFNFELFEPVRTVDFTATGGGTSSGGSTMYMLPDFSINTQLGDDGTWFLGGGVFLASGMGVDQDVIGTMPFLHPMGLDNQFDGQIFSQYQMWKIAPALAKKFDKLSVGAALNFDYQQLALRQTFSNATAIPANSFGPGSPAFGPGQYRIGVDLATPTGALGYGWELGLLYDVSEMLSIGATYVSQQNFGDLNYRLAAGSVNYQVGNTLYTNQNGVYSLSGMNFPAQYSVGAAVRPLEGLTIAADFKVINYSSTMKTLNINGAFNTNTGGTPGTASSMPLSVGWNDVTVWAVAVQYQPWESSVVRAGYNRGTTPFGDGATTSNNWAFPAITQSHYTLGYTQYIGKNWQTTLAYVNAPTVNQTGAYGDRISLGGSSYTLGLSYLYK